MWALLAGAALAVAVTYSRIAPERLYNVDEGGGAGGLGRALVFLNYPVTLVAIAIAVVAARRLGGRRAGAVAALAVALCLLVGWPGVVEESDLDAKPVNALPAAGVLLAVVLTFRAARSRGLGAPPRSARWDRARVALAAVIVAASVPWIAAELGFSPDLEPVFLTGEPRPEPGHPDLVAVHLGHHHGTDGALLALSALALSRELPRFRPRARELLGGYLALMLVYGLANALQDFWLEQLVKRGATSFELPSMLRPTLSPAWGALLAAALAIHLAVTRVGRFRRARTGGAT